MPCVSPDGKPTTTGMALLKSLKDGPLSPEEVASRTGRPLYSVRSGLRELRNAGFVEEIDGKYKLSEKGQKTA
ncbi:MAG: winged helix-turn-helix domain-containing protein [Candidatus Bathyarchaeia archaeon]